MRRPIVYEYCLNWMAFCVQFRKRQAEVAIVFSGGRGTGKGFFVRDFGRIFGQHFLQISHARHLTGNFNAHLEERIVLFVDGAYWAGDKQGEAVLKHLTTEPTLPIERKFRDVEHPYRLRELNGTESHLAFLYFLNAEDVNGPASREKWQGAIELLHAALGLTSLPSKGVHEAFIDVRDLRIPPTIRT